MDTKPDKYTELAREFLGINPNGIANHSIRTRHQEREDDLATLLRRVAREQIERGDALRDTLISRPDVANCNTPGYVRWDEIVGRVLAEDAAIREGEKMMSDLNCAKCGRGLATNEKMPLTVSIGGGIDYKERPNNSTGTFVETNYQCSHCGHLWKSRAYVEDARHDR